MKQRILEKLEAIRLRKKGFSLNEITREVGVAKSSVSLWVRNIDLDEQAKSRLLTKIKLGQLNAGESKRNKVRKDLDNYFSAALKNLESEKLSPEIAKAMCAIIYWCEGAKNPYGGGRFTNSDPKLMATFLYLFRNSFTLDERKFRVCVHLHAYHKKRKQLEFWSKVTKIDVCQFIKPFQKPNTRIRVREGYQGCASVYYHSNDIARQLLMTAKAFLSKVRELS